MNALVTESYQFQLLAKWAMDVKMEETAIENVSNDFQLAKLFVTTIREFFESTSLHGFKYLVQRGRSVYEK